MTMNPNYQKSVLNTFSSAAQVLTTGLNINFVNNDILTGCSIAHTAGSPTVTLKKPGLYAVSFEADVLPAAEGNVTVNMQNNGVTIPGATTTVTGATTSTIRVVLDTIIKVNPSCCAIDATKNITFNNAGIGATYTNASVNVIKLC